jgi:RNA recognition motif-containing protein
LKDAFRKYGHIKNVSMKRSYAFVEFTDAKDAKYGNFNIKAVDRMNGKELDGSRLVV